MVSCLQTVPDTYQNADALARVAVPAMLNRVVDEAVDQPLGRIIPKEGQRDHYGDNVASLRDLGRMLRVVETVGKHGSRP